MQISEAFPSKYLKAADLKGRQVSVKMERAEYELIGDDRKLILYFQGKEKGLVLNKTNANNISMIYGDDTDDWTGGEIILFESMVDYQGRTVPAIRVKAPVRKAVNATSPQAPPQRAAQTNRRMPEMADAGNGDPRSNDDMDDEIPF